MTLRTSEFVSFVPLMTFAAVEIPKMVFMYVVGLHCRRAFGQSRVISVAGLTLFGFDAFGRWRFFVAGFAGESFGRMTIRQKKRLPPGEDCETKTAANVVNRRSKK